MSLRTGLNRLASGLIVFGVSLMVVMAMPGGASALAVPPKPVDSPVVDQTGTLNEEQKRDLAAKIAKERSETGNEIAILMIKTLDGDSLEEYSLEVARGWGIGQKDRDSGVLLLIAKDDRKLRIEVGYGLEGALPDIRASQIIRDRISPEFKQDKYYEGISSGIDGIVAAVHGEKDPNLKPDGQTADSGGGWVEWLTFAGIGGVILLSWLSAILGRTKSWWLGGVLGGVGGVIVALFVGFVFWGIIAIVVLAILGLLFDKTVSANYKQAAKGNRDTPSWWAGGPWLGGGGSGGSSGGFGGFSGGSFGGGGSSGDW